MAYAELAALSRRIRTVERARIGATLQFGAFERAGLTADLIDFAPGYIDELERIEAALKRRLVKEAVASDVEPWLAAVVDYVGETVGLGPLVLYVCGLTPPLNAFANPAKLWKYYGLHVSDGSAIRAKRGELAGFSLLLRSYALQRIADPIVKERESLYRTVYDERKEHTLVTHPPMNEDCPTCALALKKTSEHRDGKAYTRERKAPSMDCANLGGIHWTDGHRHRDAMRVTAKRVWLDVWKAANGKMAVTA